jgi:hypothetical protein
MKVATLVFALLVTCGSAYADPNCNGCKSEDTRPVARTAVPVPLLTAPPAAPCNLKSNIYFTSVFPSFRLSSAC